jgi:hypothetical protein
MRIKFGILLGGIFLASFCILTKVEAAPKCPIISPGDDIKIIGKSTLYYVDATLTYRYYPSMAIYRSWNGPHQAYKVVPEDCMANLKQPTAFPLAINFRPGSVIVKRQNSDDLYTILPGNTLAPISTSTAHILYKDKQPMVISSQEWPNYLYFAPIVKENVVHAGMLLVANKKYYWINPQRVVQEISTKGLTANKLTSDFFTTVSSTVFSTLKRGTRIDVLVPQLTDKTQLSVKVTTPNPLPPTLPIPATSTPSTSTIKTRNVTLQPFSNDSPWNTPLAVTTQLGDSKDLCSKDLDDTTISTAINGREWSHPVYISRETDPLVSIYSNTTDLKKDKPLAIIHIPKDARPALPDFSKNPDSDAHLNIIDPVKKEVHEMWRAKWVVGDKIIVWAYTKNSLTGSGIEKGGARAYGGSAIAGLIRSGELKDGIHHALALAIPRAKQRLKNTPIWPATTIDDFASKDYRGNIPMGQLVALPTTTDLSKLNLSTQGKILAETLKNFGAYNVDSSGDITLYVETNAAKEMDSHLEDDWKKLRPLLKCVVNNRKDNVGGGSGQVKRLAPLALPI